MPAASKTRLLILGGTGEAAQLAERALARAGDRLEVTSSLAGRVAAPRLPPGLVRVGGFGGAEGLAASLRDAGFDMVVDATHPFAATISAHARAACDALGLPRLVLSRPDWRPHPDDRWTWADDVDQAASLLPGLGRRALLTVGAGAAAAFAAAEGVWCLVRLVTPPAQPLPLADYEILPARGPFTLAGELALLRDRRIAVVVTKASGGTATEAKLVAARELRLPVLLLRRPPPEAGPRVETVEQALAWVMGRLGPAD